MSTVITARWILPIDRPPIRNGSIEVESGIIRGIGRAGLVLGRQPLDLGDVALMPRLVNAHTHLEFSDLPQPVGHPGMRLSDWIEHAVAARRGATRESAGAAIAEGIQEIAATSTALVGEISTPPVRYPHPPSGLTIQTFAEVLGLDSDRGNERLQSATQHLGEQVASGGVSPHSPYSTPPDLILRCIELSQKQKVPVAMHVAESPDERELLTHGRGSFAETLRRWNIWPADVFPWSIPEPIVWLIERLATAPRALIVHGNDLKDREIEVLSRHPNLSVVFCPRTHDYFRHAKHPVDRLLAAGVRVALGTDSRASNPDLNVWREAQFLLRHRQDLRPDAVLAMVTVNGHIAIHGGTDAGTLATGQPARFHIVPTIANSFDQLFGDLASA